MAISADSETVDENSYCTARRDSTFHRTLYPRPPFIYLKHPFFFYLNIKLQKRKKNVGYFYFKSKKKKKKSCDAINSIGKFRVWKEQSTEFGSYCSFLLTFFFFKLAV